MHGVSTSNLPLFKGQQYSVPADLLPTSSLDPMIQPYRLALNTTSLFLPWSCCDRDPLALKVPLSECLKFALFVPFSLQVKCHLFRQAYLTIQRGPPPVTPLQYSIFSSSPWPVWKAILLMTLYSSWERKTMAVWGQKLRVHSCIPNT